MNEILAKLVCHSLTWIVHAVHELGIDIDFGSPVASAPAAPTLALLHASLNDERGDR